MEEVILKRQEIHSRQSKEVFSERQILMELNGSKNLTNFRS